MSDLTTDEMVEKAARVKAGEALWLRMSDVLERKAFPFTEAPSRYTYLAHAKAMVDVVADDLRANGAAQALHQSICSHSKCPGGFLCCCARAGGGDRAPATPEEFRRWLAAHDSEVVAQALRDAAEACTVTIPDHTVTKRAALGYKIQVVFTEDLTARADAIERGES